MEMGSTHKAVYIVLATIFALFLSYPFLVKADTVSTSPADLVSNDKVVYILPEAGFIFPDNPLFIIKQIRDEIVLLLPQDSEARVRLMIQMSDKYTVYADKMERTSKPQQAVKMFTQSFQLQNQIVQTLEAIRDDRTREVLSQELKELAIQSNIKQAEIIRMLIDDVASAEQSMLVEHLNENMIIRKKLQSL